MIERYTREEMGRIWTDENRYQAWLEVELLACEAWSELGIIPKEDVEKLRENASFDIDRILEIEQETRHDVVAFTRAVSETVGEEKKWVHYGLTSTDVVDTALSYLMKQANVIIRKDIVNFIEILKNKAIEHKHTVMMGRTHGVHAEPTTFGLKMALWYEEMKRNLKRFDDACAVIETGKLSGAVGTYANIDPNVEQYVCEKLGSRRHLFQRKHYNVIVMHSIWGRYHLLQHRLKSSLPRFAVFKRQKHAKSKSSLIKDKKDHQRCHINGTQLALKI